MKERPILFSAPMVRALLAGTKTQTRRVVKIDGLDWLGTSGDDKDHPQNWGFEDGNTGRWWALGEGDMVDNVFKCPYGQPGDQLWVRETWAGTLTNVVASVIEEEVGTQRCITAYRATYEGEKSPFGKWVPSIHMPRWASRITLKITDLRVERLSAISELDATAEGVQAKHTADADWSARDAFRVLWESINGGGSWDADPWVWCVAFKRIEGQR